VRDWGKGIAETDLKHRGMGMRIMKYRADMIGGILDIQSNEPGVGTTVVCTIPTPPPQPSTHPTHG
jgi:signal transduction histidine kinase